LTAFAGPEGLAGLKRWSCGHGRHHAGSAKFGDKIDLQGIRLRTKIGLPHERWPLELILLLAAPGLNPAWHVI
jgi:hypothetical protein